MAKKRKATGRQGQPTGPKEVDSADARLGPISTYKDVADSEDEFFMERDRLMLDDEPDSKRRRRHDDDIELSDEEILGDDDSSEESDEKPEKKQPPKSKRKKAVESDDEGGEEEEGEGDEGWWGSSRKEYYNADNIETEGDAMEEEAEARRLQQKKLSKMTDEDFMFDGSEWLAAGDDGGEGDDKDEPVTEVLKDVEITDEMDSQERYRILKSRYPEFDHLAGELQKQEALLDGLRVGAKIQGAKSLEAVKYWVLGCYVAALAGYFAVLTSPARDASKANKTLSPSDLRDHDIMETLVSCREAWSKIKDLRSTRSSAGEEEKEDGGALPVVPEELSEPATAGKEAEKAAKEAKRKEAASAKKRAAKARELDGTVADLYNLPLVNKKSKKKSGKSAADAHGDGSDSDFGEETMLDARTAAEKAARKKSLKFYTSQIAQKANRRADAGRDAGGDADIPYRERLKDRQARLLREAQGRAQKTSRRGADLDTNKDNGSDDEEDSKAKAMRDDEDEYYDMVANKSNQKKEGKAARKAALAAATKADRVVEKEEVDENGKRKITYAIEKNKGLTPRRKKEVRNPRVKKRMQFEAKQKKLASMKPIWKGGEPKGGYRGELSGINIGVVKSVKL
ncbi:U3 small nucleolar RNA-associated protein 3 [Geosmithia morbida]|uniref:U3 small nucleolar RNA-associated protein 3 n=1 Tax=Geosmithia morbida TaxID=1094350 RepID=A0A9P5D659_9HYPO|nr:U3 small nucleolar RNA-associated protein 3 [Geosmithia morbida]KAF4123169.1 U3 small nucleolar RNA-associated protein 3 [Geosmithia morbida]